MANFFKKQDNYTDNYDNYYGYDNNQYISDGHEYFDSSYDYVGSEYDYSQGQFYSNNDVYYENLSDNYGYDNFGNTGYIDQNVYELSNKINDSLDNDMNYQMYNTSAIQVPYNSGYGYSDTQSDYYTQNMYNTNCLPTDDISFDDTYIVQNQYYDDEEKLFTLKDFLSLGICIVFAFVLAYLITTYVAQHTKVDGQSMNYNLNNGDILIIDKLSYHFNNPERFDIVVFPIKSKEKTYFIKRIIGLPNDTVEIDNDGNIFVNGDLLNENYGLETITSPGVNNSITLGEDEYFVLGDNRNHSLDSRSIEVGNVKREDIVGKAIFRLWKIEDFGQIDNLKNAKINSEGGSTTTGE